MIKVMQKLFGGVVNEQNYGEFLKELGKRFVPKAEYNARVSELKALKAAAEERTATAEELAEAKAATEGLQGEVARLKVAAEEQAAVYQAGIEEERRKRLVELELMKAGAKNLQAAGALLDLTVVLAGESDTEMANRIAEQVSKLKVAEGTAFLFERESAPGAAEWLGFVPAEASDEQEVGYAGSFKLRLAQAQGASDCLGAIRVKQEAAANGFII